ncbi:MAG: hypothetical protein V4581_00105 [Bacteroidota bacterium]
MKYKLLIIALFALHTAKAQIEIPTLEELSLPSSPAFVLLDESPANIEKPTNPKAVAISLINVWEGSGAIEFTPYWLFDQPTYTFQNDINNSKPFWQTFALSAATSKSSDTTNISVGFRVQLFRQYADVAALTNIEGLIAIELAVMDPKDINMDEVNRLVKLLSEERGKIKWNVELAGAYSGQSSENSGLAGNKLGAWLNIRHTPKDFPLDVVVLGRYSRQFGNQFPNESSFVDAGGSISKQGKNFDLQLEYVYRWDTTLKTNYDRLALVANYQIMPGIVAVASVGKNFDDVNNVFTALGVKFGLSRQKAL